MTYLYMAVALCAVALVGVAVWGLGGNSADQDRMQIGASENPVTTPVPQVLGSASAVKLPASEPPTVAQNPDPEPPKATDPPTAPVVAPVSNPNVTSLKMPVGGSIAAVFSVDQLVYSSTPNQWSTHQGIDIAAQAGSEIAAAAKGTVKEIIEDPLMGRTVVIEHTGGLMTKYCGLDEITVKAGDTVNQGAKIGTLGTILMEVQDGSHLHFEVHKDGKAINPDSYLDMPPES